MNPKLNQPLRNGSPLPGLLLNSRRGYLVIDVTWNDEGRRCATSYLAHKRPIDAMARAMARRQAALGISYDITARQAWRRLRQHYAAV